MQPVPWTMTTFNVNVTGRDIEQGCLGDSNNCPNVLAVRRAVVRVLWGGRMPKRIRLSMPVPYPDPDDGVSYMQVIVGGATFGVEVVDRGVLLMNIDQAIPRDVQHWILRYDSADMDNEPEPMRWSFNAEYRQVGGGRGSSS